MPKSMQKPNPTAPSKAGLAVKPVKDQELVKDLEPTDQQIENVSGGGATYGTRFFSDAALKNQVAPIRDALVNLRELRL